MTYIAEELFETRDGGRILIRNCESLEELDACIRLQIETWGYSEGEVIPRKVFTVARRIGGQVIGAFDLRISEEADNLIGFAMALPGVISRQNTPPKPYLHSHMLAVKP
jgi:predicted GNAT superfamily acetyltransferase